MDETFRALFALLTLLFAVTACGGGGGGEEPAHPPSISNLRYAPATALQAPDGTATINGSFDFIDAGSDIASLRITSSGGVDLSLPTPALAGIRSGTGTGTFVVSVDRIDKYTFELWLIDSRGSAVGRDALRGGGSVDLPLALRCSGLTHGSTVGERRFRSLRAMRAP